MATPRKHWFRVADSIGHEPWSNDELACLVRLMAHLNTRWARDGIDADQAGQVALGTTEVMRISSRRRPDVALTLLRRLADLTSMSVRSEGNVTWISWPKYAEFQHPTTRKEPESRPRAAPSGTHPHPHTQDAEKSSARSRSRQSSGKPSKPLPPEWCLRCAEVLRENLVDVPGARFPRGFLRRWAVEIEALSREAPEIAELPSEAEREARVDAAIRWGLGPENLGREYEVVIRSGRSLREKWPQLVAAARRRRRESRDPEDMFESLRQTMGNA